MNCERNRKIFTEDTVAVYLEINEAVVTVLENQQVRDLLDYCPIYSDDNIADVVVNSIDNNVVTCQVYITRDWESYSTLDVEIPIDYLTKTDAVEAALAQRKAERDEKERRRAELQKDEKYQEYLKLKEQFKDV